MAYENRNRDRSETRRVRRERVEGNRAVVYYGRPVPEWPQAWML